MLPSSINPPDDGEPLEVISGAQLGDGPVPARKWLVDSWIPSGGNVCLLGGDGGVGKSLLAQQLATAVATGTQWLGQPVLSGPVLYVSCEDDRDELHRRQAAINARQGVAWRQLENLHFVDRVGRDNSIV